MSSSLIPVKSEYERLLEEVKKLQARLAELTALRDDLLYHVCPALRALYDEKIASLERELLAARMYLREKQRIIEILQAQLNRKKKLSFEKAEEQARTEYREYEEELKRKAEEAKKFPPVRLPSETDIMMRFIAIIISVLDEQPTLK